MTPPFTLGKKERLKSRKQTELLFQKGKRFSLSPFRVLYLFTEGAAPGIQFGTGAGTRQFKRAVDRNRIKRLVRESYRLQKLPLQDAAMAARKEVQLFFIYTGKEIPAYEEVYAKMGKAIARLLHQLTTTS